MSRCTCASDTEAGEQGPYDAENCSSRKLSDSDSDLAQDTEAPRCQDSLLGLGAPERTSWEAHNYGIATEELLYGYAGDANRARDDSDLTVRLGVWNHFQYSVLSSQSSSGPAGSASDGYGLGRGAAGPDRRCTTTAAGALRVIV